MCASKHRLGGREDGWVAVSQGGHGGHPLIPLVPFNEESSKKPFTVLWLFSQSPNSCSLPVLQSSCKPQGVQAHGRNQL